MSVFRSSDGNEWRIYFDAFLLANIQKETDIDLADVSAGGWAKLETDAGAVGRVLAIVCREEATARKIDSRTFVRTIRGEAIDLARAALIAEGADFFPPSEWSAILSNLARRKVARDQTENMQTALSMLGGMKPEEVVPLAEAFMRLDELTKAKLVAEFSDSPNGQASTADSATGPGATPSPPVTDSQELAELTAVG